MLNASPRLGRALAALRLEVEGTDTCPFRVATIEALLIAYDERWAAGHPFRSLAIEEEIESPLVDPDTEKLTEWRYGGKLDVYAVHQGTNEELIVDHKTTSEEISDEGAAYWQHLQVDSQISQYMLNAMEQGRDPAGLLYDVVRKPKIRPKAVSKKDQHWLGGAGIYADQQLTIGVSKALYSELEANEFRETPTLFGMRVLQWARNTHCFERRRVNRLSTELLSHLNGITYAAKDIETARSRGLEGHYKNPGSCKKWGRCCAFLPLCAGTDTPDSDRWVEKAPHAELDNVDDGRNLMTNSRFSTFGRCARLHYYKYELGIAPAREEESDALAFGTLWHTAQEKWWQDDETTGEER